MHQALYRKYRPQTFTDLVGQNPIRITLENEIANNRLAHAYLFSGPRGIGKTTTARLLAKAVNCPKRKGSEPCGKCDFCQEIVAGRSMDLIEIDAASHTGVDNVRENIIENARFVPQRAKYKIFIIDEVHMLSISAFNALLKTLEEPPEHVIFILATTEIHRVPETIISRCQRFDFKRVGVDELVKRLKFIAKNEKVTVDESILKNISRRAEGSVRDVEVLLGQIMALGEKNISAEEASLVIPHSNINLVMEFFRYLVQRDNPAAIALINKLVEEGVNLQDFSRELIDFLRKILLSKISGSISEVTALELDQGAAKELKDQMALLPVGELVAMIEQFRKRSRELKYAQIIQLPLELAVLELNKAETSDQPRQVENSSGRGLSVKSPQKADKEQISSVKRPISEINKKSIKIEEVEKAWPEIINELRSYNHSIALSLKVGLPVEIKNEKLIIGFRYKFHAERIKEAKVRSIIEDAFKKVLGIRFKVNVLVLSEEEFNRKFKGLFPDSSERDTWHQAMQVFGSEVLEEE